MFASEEIDDSKDAAVKEDLAKFEVNPVIKYEEFISAKTEDERKDIGRE